MSDKATGMLQTITGSQSEALTVGAAPGYLTGRQGAGAFKNVLYNLAGQSKGTAMVAVVKRSYSSGLMGGSRLLDALGLAAPTQGVWEEPSIDVNLFNTGVCFLSGEQGVQHLGEFELFS